MSNDLAAKFDALVRAEGEGLFRFLYWSLGHREDARDAVQDVLVRAYRGLPRLREEGSAKAWIYRIATNVAHDHRSYRRRIPRTLGTTPGEDEPGRELGVSGEPTPLRALQGRETTERLAAALARLSPELREPLVLHAVSELKYWEIAEMLGWPIGTVTSRIHAARLQLQAFLT